MCRVSQQILQRRSSLILKRLEEGVDVKDESTRSTQSVPKLGLPAPVPTRALADTAASAPRVLTVEPSSPNRLTAVNLVLATSPEAEDANEGRRDLQGGLSAMGLMRVSSEDRAGNPSVGIDVASVSSETTASKKNKKKKKRKSKVSISGDLPTELDTSDKDVAITAKGGGGGRGFGARSFGRGSPETKGSSGDADDLDDDEGEFELGPERLKELMYKPPPVMMAVEDRLTAPQQGIVLYLCGFPLLSRQRITWS